ncbi:twitching motility protein PilT [Pilimelia terevasa]|uniref:Twitching motility protein PilT n=1 Tax=Pilimelia terevasa TaxID=53372 RepID=A0A8J3BLW1_9ACTN|nr:type IV pilus twitching motility protein PilT [Pilimelia terevasa]GGK28564.1 twitching motility protein PilT [Pilimelia terevasa]
MASHALHDTLVYPPMSGDRSYLHRMLVDLVRLRGSDLHLSAGAPPTMRLHGGLTAMPGYDRLSQADTAMLVRAACDDEQIVRFEREHEIDFSMSLDDVSRFRVNAYMQRGSCGAAFRAIPHEIRPLEDLGVPDTVNRFARLTRGLVLVTGPTGSGKSTTLAALLDLANRTRSGHIITIEDPIEYLHPHKRCLVNQREVGTDTDSFAAALRHALRQDPDIILVGELRDLETTATALTAAETGHLVLGTLHTQSAVQTIDRIIDMYPPHQQSQVRSQLSVTLQGVVSQALCKSADGESRVVVTEVMSTTPAVRALIREGKTVQIPSFMQSGTGEGMLSFDQHLAERLANQRINYQDAITLAHSPDDFRRLTGRA